MGAAAPAPTFGTIDELLRTDSDAPALRAVDGRDHLSHAALAVLAASLDLRALGLPRAARLCASLPNGPEAAAAGKAGAGGWGARHRAVGVLEATRFAIGG